MVEREIRSAQIGMKMLRDRLRNESAMKRVLGPWIRKTRERTPMPPPGCVVASLYVSYRTVCKTSRRAKRKYI
jgi:hypothetical protein